MTESAHPRILITGAGGFLGRTAADYLRSSGFDLLACDLKNAPRTLDVLDREAMLEVALGFQPRVYVHAAALTTAKLENELDLIDVNVRGTLNALLAARSAKVSHFVLFSSAGVYTPGQPEPITEEGESSSARAYSLSKRLAEDACVIGKTPAMTVWLLRLGPIYGPGEVPSETRSRASLMYEIARIASRRTTVESGKSVLDAEFTLPRAPDDVYNWLHTRDLGRLLESISMRPTDGGTHLYNVAGPGVTALELVRIFDRIRPESGLESRISWNPNPPARHGALDASKLRREIGFQATVPLEQGILDYLEARIEQPLEVRP